MTAVAAMLAVVALASLAGGVSGWLDVLTHFEPLIASACLAAMIVALMLRRQVGTIAASLCLLGLVASLAVMAPELIARASAQRGAQGGMRVRLLQLYLWEGNRDTERTIAFIRRTNADIVVIEEARQSAAGVPAALAGLYPYRTKCRTCATLVLSRWPTVQRKPARLEGPDPFTWAQLRAPDGGVISVIGVHFYWPLPPGVQRYQSASLVKLARRFDPSSLIVAGDFNSTPWSYEMRRQDRALGIERRTRALFSWPAGHVSPLDLPAAFPVLAIDQVYAGPAWRTVSVERGPRVGSDHYPVLVTPGPGRPDQPPSWSRTAATAQVWGQAVGRGHGVAGEARADRHGFDRRHRSGQALAGIVSRKLKAVPVGLLEVRRQFLLVEERDRGQPTVLDREGRGEAIRPDPAHDRTDRPGATKGERRQGVGAGVGRGIELEHEVSGRRIGQADDASLQLRGRDAVDRHGLQLWRLLRLRAVEGRQVHRTPTRQAVFTAMQADDPGIEGFDPLLVAVECARLAPGPWPPVEYMTVQLGYLAQRRGPVGYDPVGMVVRRRADRAVDIAVQGLGGDLGGSMPGVGAGDLGERSVAGERELATRGALGALEDRAAYGLREGGVPHPVEHDLGDGSSSPVLSLARLVPGGARQAGDGAGLRRRGCPRR